MKKRLPNTIYTLVLTAITVVSWVFFDIYRAIKKPLPVVVPNEIIEPLNPNFDSAVYDKLENRKYFEEGTFKESEIKKAIPSAETEEKPNKDKNREPEVKDENNNSEE